MESFTQLDIKNKKSKKISSSEIFTLNLERTVEWFGGVNFDNLEKVIMRLKSLCFISADEEIHLLINSYGGPTGIGLSFYELTKNLLKPNLTTIGSGYVDSSGIIIFLSGNRRYLTKNTTLLFHLANRSLETNRRLSTKDMKDMLEEDGLRNLQYAETVSSVLEGKFSQKKILEMMEGNTLLTAQNALDMGLAHGLL